MINEPRLSTVQPLNCAKAQYLLSDHNFSLVSIGHNIKNKTMTIYVNKGIFSEHLHCITARDLQQVMLVVYNPSYWLAVQCWRRRCGKILKNSNIF